MLVSVMSRLGREVESSGALRKPDDYRIQALVDGLDVIAHHMEGKWGVDRLRLLVPDVLRARFDRQKDLLDEAIHDGRPAYVAPQVEAMKRAWAALDQAATENGATGLAPEVWECTLPSTGETVALVRTDAEAHHVARDRRAFTVAEIGMLIDRLGTTILNVKRLFPGAAITAVSKNTVGDGMGEDDIPF